MRSASQSWCPRQLETAGMCTPDSMQRVANNGRKSWWVVRLTAASFAGRSIDFWHSKTCITDHRIRQRILLCALGVLCGPRLLERVLVLREQRIEAVGRALDHSE